ncbi:MAG: transcriptional regulator [Desulfurococcales archaeon]|jgi:probable regulatory domain-containing protein
MGENIPLKPMGKEDIRKLELALIMGTLFREDVLDKIREAEDRLTWLDSLIIAAGALARERANYTAEKIAEELGRSEATIRNHLSGKTEAGKLVRDTFERLKVKGGTLELPTITTQALAEEMKSLKEKLTLAEEKAQRLEKKLNDVKESLTKILNEISAL